MFVRIIYKHDRITAMPVEESLDSKNNVVITYGNKPCVIPMPLSVPVGNRCYHNMPLQIWIYKKETGVL
jgi:hypothetical protein